MQTNLYRIDDVLLRTGLVAVIAVFFVGQFLFASMASTGFSAVEVGLLALLVVAPLAMLIAGYLVRRRERQVVDLWKLIEAHGQVSAKHLCATSGFSRRGLLGAVRLINRRGRGLLVWDETDDVIRAGNMELQPHSTLTHTETCPSCGAKVNVEVCTRSRDGYTCPYCNGGLDSDRINELLRKLHADERERAREAEQQHTAPLEFSAPAPVARPGMPMNMGVFIVLMIVFWPAALIYAIHKYQNQ